MASKTNKPVKDSKQQPIQVYVRCRPLSRSEIHQKCTSAVRIQGSRDISVQDRTNSKLVKSFAFDRVFGPESGQVEVYHNVVEPLISDILAGFNCTVFAYGQTGTGKTYTMEGQNLEDPNKLFDSDSKGGIIPRTMSALFDELRILQSEFTVRISLLEIYNEDVYDLLSPDPLPSKLRMFDDATKKGSVILQGLQEVMVHTRTQAFAELRKGSSKKQVASTLVNVQSSRSHTVFCVTVHMKENSMRGEELLKTGKLYLVDLAGSENIGRSGSVDKRAREAGTINQSLLTLGRVMSCLVEHQPHIPYRESKLTRLLQDSLGGRTKTSFIATITPASSNIEETLSTLDYACKAKSITNKPEINQKVSKKAVMKEYMDVIEDLKTKLDLHRKGSGVYIADENYKEMQNEWADRNKELSEVVAEMKAVSQRMETAEENFKNLNSAIEEKTQKVHKVDTMLKEVRMKVKQAEKQLDQMKKDNMEAEELVQKAVVKENELRKRASALLEVNDEYEEFCSKVRERLQMSRSSVQSNKSLVKTLHQELISFANHVSSLFNSLLSEFQFLIDTVQYVDKEASHVSDDAKDFLQRINSLSTFCRSSLQQLLKVFEDKDQWKNEWNRKSFSELKLSFESSVELLKAIYKIACDGYKAYMTIMSTLPRDILSLIELCKEERVKLDKIFKSKSLEIQAQTKRMDSILAEKTDALEGVSTAVLTDMHQKKNLKFECIKNSEQSVLDVKKCLKGVFLLNSQLNSEVNSLDKRIDQNLTELEDRVHDYNATFEDQLKETQCISQATKADVSSASTSSLSNVSQKIHSIFPIQQKASECIKDISRTMENMKNNHKTALQSLESSFETSLSIRQEKSCSSPEEDRIANEVESVAPESSEGIMIKKNKTVDRLKSLVEQPCNSLESFKAHAAEFQSQVDYLDSRAKIMVETEIKSNIVQDRRTGHTPARKTIILPAGATLSPNFVKIVNHRVQSSDKNIKKLFHKAEKQNVRQEEYASDSEVTCRKKGVRPVSLVKASSMADLRKTDNFVQPEPPKGRNLHPMKKKILL